MAEGYTYAGEYEAALNTIENVLQSDTDNAEALLAKGQLKMQFGEYTEALDIFTQLAEQDDENADAINMLGRAYYELGQFDSALAQFEAAKAIDPNNAAFYINSFTTKRIKGDFLQALEESETAIAKAEPEQLMQAYNSRGSLYLELSDTDAAAESWELTLEQEAIDPVGHVLQAFARIGLQDDSQAMRSILRSLEINPDLLDAYNARSIVHLRSGRIEKALSDINIALEKNPNHVISLQTRATINSKKEDPDTEAALNDLAKALSVNPSNPYILNQRCELYLSTQVIDKAIADCTKAIETNPNYTPAYTQRGQAYIAQKNYESAEQDFTRIIEINDALEKPQVADVYGSRAYARVELGDNEGAEADMTEAITLDPDNPQYYQLRGMLRFIAEKPEAVGQDLRKAQELYKAQGEDNEELNQMLETLEQTGLL